MYPFVETIKISEGTVSLPELHEARMNTTRRDLFGQTAGLKLKEIFSQTDIPQQGMWKCRILYRENVEKIEFIPYQNPVIRTLMLVEHDNLHYQYKSTDRSEIEKLKSRAGGCSDILIVREGLVTDSSFCNVAFFDGYHWITPKAPLLKGVMREHLLNRGMLIERHIPASMVHEFQLIMLFNAMNDFGQILLPVHEIYFSFPTGGSCGF
ncbi:MAG: aminotransferase class IV [Bacteroidales bacterium]